MSLEGAYDDDNVFAKILRGELPCHKVYEDDAVIAFMDLFPQSPGHTLVVPKVKARNLFEISEPDLAAAMARVKKVAQGVRAALAPDGIVVTQFNGAPAGQSVFHIHFHIIPRTEGAPLAKHGAAKADDTELVEQARKIAAAIPD